METTRTGIILCTERYEQCVQFYHGTLGLPLMHALDDDHSQLTCLDFGGGQYLMIEPDDEWTREGRDNGRNPVILRFNVEDVDREAARLRDKGVAVEIRREPWGTVADFFDPDGNRCSLREERTFGP